MANHIKLELSRDTRRGADNDDVNCLVASKLGLASGRLSRRNALWFKKARSRGCSIKRLI